MNILGFEKLLYHPEKLSKIRDDKHQFPVHATISLGNYCNHKCLWCSAYEYQLEKDNQINIELLLDWLQRASGRGLKAVGYVGNGEPLDHLTAISLFTDHIKKQNYPNPVIVSPDLGSVKRVRKIADLLDLPFAILDKVRKKPNVVTKVNLLGDVRGKTAILIDDMIDTGHTICAAIKKIIQEDIEKIYVYSTHPVFSKPAPGNIFKLGISEMVVTDVIPITKNYKKLQVLSVASLLSNAVENIHQNKSVSALFN